MKIILLKNIDKLGKQGDVIKIKNGYARNFIIPFKKGILATKDNLSILKKIQSKNDYKNNYKKIKEIQNLTIIIPVSTDKNEKIYGSINIPKIIKLMKNLNFNINKDNIKNDVFIKKIGTYELIINFKNPTNKIKIFLTIIKK